MYLARDWSYRFMRLSAGRSSRSHVLIESIHGFHSLVDGWSRSGFGSDIGVGEYHLFHFSCCFYPLLHAKGVLQLLLAAFGVLSAAARVMGYSSRCWLHSRSFFLLLLSAAARVRGYSSCCWPHSGSFFLLLLDAFGVSFPAASICCSNAKC